MVKAIMAKVSWSIILLILKLLWHCVGFVMIMCISIREKVGKKVGLCEPPEPPVFDPYSSSQSASSISVEEDILQDMANYWDKCD
jgi:hypothetical protein